MPHHFFILLILSFVKRQQFKKLSVRTVGCRLNQYETEKMAADLYPFGFRRAQKGEPADLYIINTCTVTHRADSSSRNLISRAIRENPDARIVVAGCYVDSDPEKIVGMEGIDVIIGNAEKSNISSILPQRLPDIFASSPQSNCEPPVVEFVENNRAWLKISDGCNQRCSFCILPAVRGKLQNRPPQEIVNEINRLTAQGFNEVVLTGVHIGHYRHREAEPIVKNLAALCRMILDQTDLPKLRLSSIEPQTVREDLVRTYANATDRICRHFHVPLQSGSLRILRMMRRPYDPDTYMRRVLAIKEAVPMTTIGADIIVGFPGETETDFDESRRLAESGLFDYLHVFSYSDRPGTRASELPGKINPNIIKTRNAVLTQISDRLRAQSHRRQVGRMIDVISERRQMAEGFFWGVSDNYIRVKMPSGHLGGKKIVRLKVTAAHDEHVEGVIVKDSSSVMEPS